MEERLPLELSSVITEFNNSNRELLMGDERLAAVGGTAEGMR